MLAVIKLRYIYIYLSTLIYEGQKWWHCFLVNLSNGTANVDNPAIKF